MEIYCLNEKKKKERYCRCQYVMLLYSISDESGRKTEAIYSARAIGCPKFEIFLDVNKTKRINWVYEFKYLGYWISTKIEWSKMIKNTMTKIRQRISSIDSFRISGLTSLHNCGALYSRPMFYLFSPGFIHDILSSLIIKEVIFLIFTAHVRLTLK